ncbi:hypothetical protein ACQ0QQ_07325 [Lysinibacillus sphaericus]
MEGLIVAIIIGLVTTLFNRKKEASSQENRPKPKPISTGSPAQTYREEPRKKREPVREEPVYTLQSQFEEKKKDIESQYAQLKKQESGYKEQIKMQRSKADANNDRNDSQYSIDFGNQDDIVKGFIFSEVFGPPRAKKPQHRK